MLRDVRGKWGKGLAVALAVSGLLLLPGAVINRRSRKRRLQWQSRPCR